MGVTDTYAERVASNDAYVRYPDERREAARLTVRWAIVVDQNAECFEVDERADAETARTMWEPVLNE